MRLIALAAGFFLSLDVLAASAAPMSENRATDKAAAILKGDPYGSTAVQARERIRTGALVQAGSTPCGKVSRPVWSFHVVVDSQEQPIDGFLDIDASTGKMVCATLPFLD